MKDFANDVEKGLSQVNKEISSKYFYDRRGSKIYNQITLLSEYYLTGCENEILNRFKTRIIEKISGKEFNLIELGPGDGSKAKILIQECRRLKIKVNYFPIDISPEYIQQIQCAFQQDLPEISIRPIISDYITGLKQLYLQTELPNLLLFLGSSIGNFDLLTTQHFLTDIWQNLHANDYILIGFDLLKNINILKAAYNDSLGITTAFNYNLLLRINQQLGGKFSLSNFIHDPIFDSKNQAMQSYLISRKKQFILIKELQKDFEFAKDEPIFLEISRKYTPSEIQFLAKNLNFNLIDNFTDPKHYFIDSLWSVIKK